MSLLQIAKELIKGRKRMERESQAWHTAAYEGDLSTVQRMLGENPAWARRWDLTPKQIKAQPHLQRETTLMRAVGQGHLEIVRAVLPHSDCTVRDLQGNTLLALAVRGGHVEVAKLLLPYSEIDARNNDGLTPLMWAATFTHYSAPHVFSPDESSAGVRLLLSAGADPLLEDALGRSALPHAILSANHAAVSVLRECCDLHAVDREGQTPVMQAAYYARWDSLRVLLPGSPLDTKDREGRDVFDLVLLLRTGDPKHYIDWAQMEALTPFISAQRAREILSRPDAELEKMPKLLAFVERHDLADALPAGSASGPETSISAQPKSSKEQKSTKSSVRRL